MRNPPPDLTTIAGRLRQALDARRDLEHRNITITEIADRCGEDRQRVGHYFTGVRTPPLDMIEALAEALGVSAGWIAFGERTRYGRTSSTSSASTAPHRRSAARPSARYCQMARTRHR